MASITIQVPDETKSELEAIAAASDLSIAQIVRFAIREKIERLNAADADEAPAIIPEIRKAA